MGFEIKDGENIQEAIEGIAGTRVAHLEPDRDDGKFVLLEINYLMRGIILIYTI